MDETSEKRYEGSNPQSPEKEETVLQRREKVHQAGLKVELRMEEVAKARSEGKPKRNDTPIELEEQVKELQRRPDLM